jgi:hypothetical protein
VGDFFKICNIFIPHIRASVLENTMKILATVGEERDPSCSINDEPEKVAAYERQ